MVGAAAGTALQREVVGHVLALDVPLKTVHSRLQRAFGKLRTKLDREYGQRGAWCQALAPLLGARESASVGAAGALGGTLFKAGAWIMQGNIKAGLVAPIALLPRGCGSRVDHPAPELSGTVLLRLGATDRRRAPDFPGGLARGLRWSPHRRGARAPDPAGHRLLQLTRSPGDDPFCRPRRGFGCRGALPADGVVLRASRAVWSEVGGRVVDSRGQPLAGVRLTLSLDTSRSLVGYASISGEETLTDKGGVFEFEDVPKNAVYLSYRGESILPGNHRFEEGERPTGLTIEAVRRCHFRLEVAPSVRSAKLLGAEGSRLQVNRFEAFGMSAFPFVQLENGRSEVLSVSEKATTLVLVGEDGNELPYPIRLDLEGVNVLRF